MPVRGNPREEEKEQVRQQPEVQANRVPFSSHWILVIISVLIALFSLAFSSIITSQENSTPTRTTYHQYQDQKDFYDHTVEHADEQP